MDRREYIRVPVGVESVFVLLEDIDTPREFPGIIEDISETGIKIVLDLKETDYITPYLKTGMKLSFNGIDSYTLFGKTIDKIISGSATIIRLTKTERTMTLGCRLAISSQKDLESYVSDVKVSTYVDRLNNPYED